MVNSFALGVEILNVKFKMSKKLNLCDFLILFSVNSFKGTN